MTKAVVSQDDLDKLFQLALKGKKEIKYVLSSEYLTRFLFQPKKLHTLLIPSLEWVLL